MSGKDATNDWLDGEPRKYRKRPVVIEAARLGEFNVFVGWEPESRTFPEFLEAHGVR